MLTEKLSIKCMSKSLDEYFRQATGLHQKLYNNMELTSDPDFIRECLEKFDLFDKSMYDMSVSEVEMCWTQHETSVKNKADELEDIISWLEEDDFSSKREKKKKYNLRNKASFLKRTMSKNSTFGGKAKLREVTKYSQQLRFGTLTDEQRKEKQRLLDKALDSYHKARTSGIFLVGRACEKGNRKVDFDLMNNKIIFKPNSKEKIEISFVCRKKKKKLLYQLDKMANEGLLPITVKINPDSICLSYDNELLNGYSFDKKAYKADLALVEKENEQQRKDVYKKHIKALETRKLAGKNPNRYLAVDLNPGEIGITIADRLSNSPDGEMKIILQECIFIGKLNNKTGKASSDEETLHRNNKKKFELAEAWKYIFELAVHHKVGFFSIEQLKFKKSKDVTSKEFNRKTKNVWHRTRSRQLIDKWCQNLGIILIEVLPQYSSFIGNMIYNEFDPIAASAELCRRAMVKYIKGGFIYPPLERINREKLVYLLGENVSLGENVAKTWVFLYNKIAQAGLRYRNKSKIDLSVNYLSSYKSKVLVLTPPKVCAHKTSFVYI